MTTLEDIVLRHDRRHISTLRPHLAPDYLAAAARLALERPGPALIVTGFIIASAGAPETDGPPGARAVADALSGLGYDVSYVTDRSSAAAMRTVAGAGQAVLEAPVADGTASAVWCADLLRRAQPTLVVAIERPGQSARGRLLNMHGADITALHARVDDLFAGRHRTIGIGDGGNEIGMGNLAPVIAATPGLPDEPCVTRVSALVAAAVSNWGAYGLVAELSLHAGRNLLPGVDDERAWLDALVTAGAVDGPSGLFRPWVDGFDPEENAGCLRALHAQLAAAGLPAAAAD